MHKSLTKFAWLSIGAAVLTILLKSAAYGVTGSVGFLSDALESLVNLAAAAMALAMLKIAEKPPDDDHIYGHTKAEYFSSVMEGVLILFAAISIFITAGDRILHPRPVEQAGIGIVISIIAALVNLMTALILYKAGKRHQSITLESDAHHLMTDVWTSVAVLGGVALVAVTGIQLLDPLVAIGVAINIVITGIQIIKKSVLGFMDTAIPYEERDTIIGILERHAQNGIQYHGLRTRQSASRRFVSVHILVPGAWTVTQGHTLLERIEHDIRHTIPKTTVTTHLEPLEDPASFQDIALDRDT